MEASYVSPLQVAESIGVLPFCVSSLLVWLHSQDKSGVDVENIRPELIGGKALHLAHMIGTSFAFDF
jgi:hypothetical protein